MKRFLVVAGLALTSLAPLSALAHSNVSLSVGLGFPAPVYVAPAPVYYAPPPPVYYYGAYQPAPVVVYRGYDRRVVYRDRYYGHGPRAYGRDYRHDRRPDDHDRGHDHHYRR